MRTSGGTYTEQLYSIQDVLGSLGNDVITGSAGSNVLLGDAGNDRVWGGRGNDIVWGEAGNDRLDGGQGWNEIKTGRGYDTVVFRADVRSDDLVDFNFRADTLLIEGTGKPAGTTYRQLVNNGTIHVSYDGYDTLLEYRGSDVLLFNVHPAELNNGNVLIG